MPATLTQSPNTISLSRDPIWIAIQSAKMSGGSPPYTPTEDNLSAYVEVWNQDSGTLIAKLGMPYNENDKLGHTNLRSLFDLSPHLPSKDSIIHQASLEYGECTKSFMTYRLKYEDKYGSPAEPVDPLVETSDFYVIHGGRSKGSNPYSPQSGNGIGLHKFRGRDDQLFHKPVHINSPQWIYFFLASGTEIQLKATFYYTDASSESASPAAWQMTLTPYKCYWVQAGYFQLDFGNYVNPGKTLYRYKIEVISAGIDLIDEFNFEIIEDYHDQELLLLAPNGFGGMETVRLKGKHSLSTSNEGITTDSMEWHDFDIEQGSMDEVNELGYNTIEASTGFYSKDYIFHLRHLLSGPVWLINTLRNRYEKQIVLSSTVEYQNEDETLYAFDIKLRPAYSDSDHNNW